SNPLVRAACCFNEPLPVVASGFAPRQLQERTVQDPSGCSHNSASACATFKNLTRWLREVRLKWVSDSQIPDPVSRIAITKGFSLMATTRMFNRRAITTAGAVLVLAFGGRATFAQMARGYGDFATIQNMELAGRFMCDYYKKNGHLPQSPQEVEAALDTLSQKVPFSPDLPPKPGFRVLFRLTMDPSVNEGSIEQWRQKAPSGWDAPINGIVTILENGDNRYVIWGSSSNSFFSPITDPNTGKPILVTGTCNQ